MPWGVQHAAGLKFKSSEREGGKPHTPHTRCTSRCCCPSPYSSGGGGPSSRLPRTPSSAAGTLFLPLRSPTRRNRDGVGGVDDLATTVLAVAVSALHQVQESKAALLVQWPTFDDATDWSTDDDDDAPRVKRSRRVKERKDWRTSAWWIQLQDADLLDYTTEAAKVFRGRFRVPHPFFLELVTLAGERSGFLREKRMPLAETGYLWNSGCVCVCLNLYLKVYEVDRRKSLVMFSPRPLLQLCFAGRRQGIEVETLRYEAKPGQAFPPPLPVCASGPFRRSVGSCVPHDVFIPVLS